MRTCTSWVHSSKHSDCQTDLWKCIGVQVAFFSLPMWSNTYSQQFKIRLLLLSKVACKGAAHDQPLYTLEFILSELLKFNFWLVLGILPHDPNHQKKMTLLRMMVCAQLQHNTTEFMQTSVGKAQPLAVVLKALTRRKRLLMSYG